MNDINHLNSEQADDREVCRDDRIRSLLTQTQEQEVLSKIIISEAARLKAASQQLLAHSKYLRTVSSKINKQYK